MQGETNRHTSVGTDFSFFCLYMLAGSIMREFGQVPIVKTRTTNLATQADQLQPRHCRNPIFPFLWLG